MVPECHLRGYTVGGIPELAEIKKISKHVSKNLIPFSRVIRTTNKNFSLIDMVYSSLKAAAFWQNIQRIFEIYKGKIFP